MPLDVLTLSVKPPQSQDMAHLLANTARQVSHLLAHRLADACGLTLVQWRVLATVGQHGVTSPARVAELAGLDKVKVSRALSTLVALDLIRKSGDQRDGRVFLLRLTRRGTAIHQRTLSVIPALEALLAAQLTQGEWRTLRRTLDRLQAYAGSLEDAAGLE
jgi:DNA-binding MarR family transcriptional regulator